MFYISSFILLNLILIALIVDIPRTNNTKNEICWNKQCIHGKCIR